ncbi:hypothetical protein TNCV_3426311 [Trichonephila clavipes]|nr:hypothetical protein TNCV_3426311 [Trichonephila clavipes]
MISSLVTLNTRHAEGPIYEKVSRLNRPPVVLVLGDGNRPRHFTTVQSHEVRRQKPTNSYIIPEGSELANMVANDAKMVAKLASKLVSKNNANLALPSRFRQVLIESPL